MAFWISERAQIVSQKRTKRAYLVSWLDEARPQILAMVQSSQQACV
jgi:hypothetical protein